MNFSFPWGIAASYVSGADRVRRGIFEKMFAGWVHI
jgi:hypothetical protein